MYCVQTLPSARAGNVAVVVAVAIGLFGVLVGSASAASSPNAGSPQIGNVFHDAQGNAAILIGRPGASTSSATASPNAAPSSCGYGYACAYENYSYSTSNWSYAFPARYANYQNLNGGCFALDSGYSFNDCTKSIYDHYGSCNGASWWWNANYGGNLDRNYDNTGAPNVTRNVNQFSSQIDCGF